MERYKILILDDERAGVQHLHDALSTGHDVVWTRSIENALFKLSESKPSFDIVICGVHLLNENMFEFLSRVREEASNQRIPFVCFRAGDSDYARISDANIEKTSRMLGATAYIAIQNISDPLRLRQAIEHELVPLIKAAP